MTSARQLAQSAGMTVESLCRRARMGTTHFERLARRGGANPEVAARLGRLCGCSPQVFLWGLQHYQAHCGGARLRAEGAAGAAPNPTPGPEEPGLPPVPHQRPRRFALLQRGAPLRKI